MNEGIIVGTGIGGQRSIVDTLRGSGFHVTTTDQMWPRDHYVKFQNKYLKRGIQGLEQNDFGEGGNILTGEDFILVADRVYVDTRIKPRLPDKLSSTDYGRVIEAIKDEGGKQLPNARIYVAPTGYFHGGKGHEHIDMFALLLPKTKLLLLDTHFGKGAGKAQEYDAIAEAERLRLRRYDGSQDGVWYPLNSLNVSKEGKEIVLIDSKAKSLDKLLRDEGIEVLEADIPQHTYPGGKIRCQTNIYRIGDDVNLLL